MTDSIVAGVSVDAPPERAFEVFTEGLGSWWPREYTWSREVLEEIVIEPREGGLCYERGPHGFRCDWGRARLGAAAARRVHVADRPASGAAARPGELDGLVDFLLAARRSH
jgi:hypothetical protein